MKTTHLLAPLLAGAIALAACGGSDPYSQASPADTAVTAETGGRASADGASVSTASTDAGDVLVDGAGLSLYGFTNDVDGQPTCADGCADAWPPLLVESDALPDGMDPEVYSVVERSDGTFQLSAGPWPLYRFAGDAAPGDINGQGSGDIWFLAAPDGSLIGGPADAPESSGTPSGY